MGTEINKANKLKWFKTKHPGVRYRSHPSRKHGAVGKDKYFVIRYQRTIVVNGVKRKERKEESLGWSSEGWTASKAAEQLASLKNAARSGDGPTSLGEKRENQEREKQRKLKDIEPSLEKTLTKLNRQFLHAKTLGFIHPKKNKQMIFNSILPNELEKILKTLRNIGK